MSQIWFILLYQPLVNALIFLYKVFFNNLGWAIITLTILIRLAIVPLVRPQLEMSKKMQELAPELEKLKKKHGNDKQKLAAAQMEIYKKAGVNPAAGCLPQIIQFLILIALFQAFSQVLKPDGVTVIEKLNQVLYPSLKLSPSSTLNLKFLWLNLSKPDVVKTNFLPNLPLPGLFLSLSVLSQVLLSKMMMPQIKKVEEQAKKTETTQDDFSAAMQTQMTYMFPLMTLLFGFSFPSGLVLYWFIFSASSLVQQYFISGWGGLENFKFQISNFKYKNGEREDKNN